MAHIEMSNCIHVAENYICSKNSVTCYRKVWCYDYYFFLRAVRVLGCFEQWW